MFAHLAAKNPNTTLALFVALQAVGALLLAINAAVYGWLALPGVAALGWAACCVVSAANVVLAFVFLSLQRTRPLHAVPVACVIGAIWAAILIGAIISGQRPEPDAPILLGEVTGSAIGRTRGNLWRDRFVLGLAGEPRSVSYVCGKRCSPGLISIADAHPPEVRYVAVKGTLIFLEADGKVVLPWEVGAERWRAERRVFLTASVLALAGLSVGGVMGWRRARQGHNRASLEALRRFSAS